MNKYDLSKVYWIFSGSPTGIAPTPAIFNYNRSKLMFIETKEVVALSHDIDDSEFMLDVLGDYATEFMAQTLVELINSDEENAMVEARKAVARLSERGFDSTVSEAVIAKLTNEIIKTFGYKGAKKFKDVKINHTNLGNNQ